jgi:hypothetical protein
VGVRLGKYLFADRTGSQFQERFRVDLFNTRKHLKGRKVVAVFVKLQSPEGFRESATRRFGKSGRFNAQ